MSAVVSTWNRESGEMRLGWWCPGCEEAHMIPVEGTRAWRWNGSLERPTLEPSILGQFSRGLPPAEPEAVVCHSFVREGVVEFLGDCTHALAGQRVAMLPEHADPFAV